MMLGLIGIGTLTVGAFAGNYLHDIKRSQLYKSKNLGLRRRQHIYMSIIFLLFSINYEFIERNMLYFVSSLGTGIA